jgi:hypothetical protein
MIGGAGMRRRDPERAGIGKWRFRARWRTDPGESGRGVERCSRLSSDIRKHFRPIVTVDRNRRGTDGVKEERSQARGNRA